MDGVSFESEEQPQVRPLTASRQASLTSWIIKTGFVKDQKEAEYLLLGITIGAVILAIVIVAFFSTPHRESAAQMQESVTQTAHEHVN